MTLFLATGLEPVPTTSPTPRSGSRSSPGRSAELDARDRGVRGLEVADRAAAAARPRCGSAALHRQGRAPRAGGSQAPWRSPSPEPRGATVDARFEALVLDFLAYLEFERGLARNTLDAYRTDLLQFGAFLAARERERDRGRARRRRRLPRRPGDRRRPGRRRQRRPPGLLAGDDQPQDRLPALLLPPPAPRGADRRRPDRDADPAGRRAASCRRCSSHARGDEAARQRHGAPTRSRCATGRCSR